MNMDYRVKQLVRGKLVPAVLSIVLGMRWMEHSGAGILKYFGIFLIIYAFIWIGQYARIRKNVRALNQKLNDLV